MTPLVAALCAFAAYFVAYRVYARFIGKRLFELSETRETPAHTLNDGVDYVPTRPAVLFGHHFASITGLAPMLGPAVAVIWGWAPAMLWVVLGAIFIGCVHDFAALVVSVRARGLSVGKVAEGVIGKRARTLFLLIILFGVALAMGVFVFVIAKLFGHFLISPSAAGPGMEGYPQAVFPSVALIVIAGISGYGLYKKGWKFGRTILIGFILSLGAIWVGLELKNGGAFDTTWPLHGTWMILLLAYAFAASVLPVWSLLQPRDFLNSLLLYLGVGLAYIGLLVANPEFDAPAFIPEPEGAPPMLPFVFIIIACGAVSGFHGLVSSGTTAKQLDKETHARPIGYGGMIGESLLGLLAVLACTAGFASPEAWHSHYASYGEVANNLGAKLGGFIEGVTSFLTSLGFPPELAAALIAMVVVSFALTTLDSATRLLRFNIEELGSSFGFKWTRNRYLSALVAVVVIALFAFYEVDGEPAALALWALFGTTNQLLAGLTLVLVTLYLKHRGKPTWYTGIPAVFVLLITLSSMVMNLSTYSSGPKADGLLFTVGCVLFLIALGVLFEALMALRRPKKASGLEIVFED